MDITITGVDNLLKDERGGWSGNVRISIHSDIGATDFAVQFRQKPSVDDGIQAAMKALSAFGKSLGKEAEFCASTICR